MRRRSLKLGEPYAIKSSAIERDDAGFFIIVGDEPPANETRGTVAVVHVRGALSQFKGEGGDSYEAIVERVACALDCDPKPSSLVLAISSPGGVVAGLNEAVFKLQKMFAAADVPTLAYVNELAASAAFALACSCERRFIPASGIAGSIGTISTMVSQKRADEAAGLDFKIITSGKRKADGHPHAEITSDAEKAEKARNNQLAEQFFALAAKALRTSPQRLEDLEAAIFVGEKAVRAGLVNAVKSLDETLAGLDKTEQRAPEPAPNTGNVTDRRAKELDTSARTGTTLPSTAQPGPSAQSGTNQEAPMNLKALIAKTEAAISTETDPGQLRVLQAKLGHLLAQAEMDGDDDDDDEDDEKRSKAAKAKKDEEQAKKAAEAAKHRAKAAEYRRKMEESEEDAKKAEEDDEEESESEARKAARAARQARALAPAFGAAATPATAGGAEAALASQAEMAERAMARVAAIENERAEERRLASIEKALNERRILPHEAKDLRTKGAAFVAEFLAMRPKALVMTEQTALQPQGATPASMGDGAPPEAVLQIEAAVKAFDGTPEQKAKLRADMIEANRKALNGAGSARY